MPSPVQRKCIFAYTQPPKAPTLSPLALGYQELCCTLQIKPQLILTPTHKALIVPLSWQMRRTEFVFYGRQKSTRHGYKKGWLFEPRMSCFQKKEGPLPVHKCCDPFQCPLVLVTDGQICRGTSSPGELGVAVTGLG